MDQDDAEDNRGTRERLLDAAIHLAGQHGQQEVTYRSVAARAGVTHGLVRHHFGSRERLLQEALARASEFDVRETGIDAAAADAFAAGLIGVLNRDPARSLLQYDAALTAVRGQAPVDDVRRDYDRYIDTIREALAGMGIREDDNALAALVFAALDGLTLQHHIYGDAERTERALERLRQVLRVLAERP